MHINSIQYTLNMYIYVCMYVVSSYSLGITHLAAFPMLVADRLPTSKRIQEQFTWTSCHPCLYPQPSKLNIA